MEGQKKKSRYKKIKLNNNVDILASSVVHDLCNQFTILGASIDLLVDNCDIEKNKDIVISIDNIRDQISSLLHSCLDYLKDSSSIKLYNYRPDIQIKKIVNILNSRKTVNIVLNSDDNIKLKNINKTEYDSIILNLISNAMDAVRGVENSEIKINSYILDGQYILEVFDNGIGLPKYYNKIFQPFFTTKGSQGNGLGLFNVKMILNKYNGIIKASRLKVGSLFCIKIDLT